MKLILIKRPKNKLTNQPNKKKQNKLTNRQAEEANKQANQTIKPTI